MISKKLRNSVGLSGIISSVLGLLVLFFPGLTAQFGTILVGISFVLIGIIYFTLFITLPSWSGWEKFGHIILGLLYIIAGLFSLINISTTTAVIFIVVGILVGMTWIYEAFLSFAMVSSSNSKGWLIISGLISLIAGMMLLFTPFWGAVTLWILLGATLLVLGVFKLIQFFTWKFRK
ncbi:DUF308 domain-containing protein [Lactococcus sp. S64]|uniref:HdeD family acid-resistance protein n=1 Tax=Lactococcus sp. S64 TaxID=2767459 RepID=UPI0019030114|nr:DUF308 domain-containing protein [Lactococcus sp. S64]MBK0084418.1 DUF308 domain-containing protein [Lactococcus sp. S64]